jgi:energy-coupling factor transport system permease protein
MWGLITGVVAAIISAPTAAYVFGGVTGSGTDVLVAAFRASGGGILASVLAQGSVSDPFDKMLSFMVVWLILRSLPARFKARQSHSVNSFSMYVARESGLHRLHPLTKIVLVLLVITAGLSMPGSWTGYFLIVLIVFPLAYWGRVLPELLRTTWKVTLPLAISVILIQSLFWGSGTPIFEFGILAPKVEGARYAVISLGRIILIMSDFLLFSMTTRPDTLMIALKQTGMPSFIAYIIVTTLQIVPSFQRKASTILDAQRSRGLETEGSMFIRARALVPIILPLVLGSLVEVEERAIAIEARAFNSTKQETSLIEIHDTNLQRNMRIAMAATMVICIIFGILWRL